jgi:hypothetical protein
VGTIGTSPLQDHCYSSSVVRRSEPGRVRARSDAVSIGVVKIDDENRITKARRQD